MLPRINENKGSSDPSATLQIQRYCDDTHHQATQRWRRSSIQITIGSAHYAMRLGRRELGRHAGNPSTELPGAAAKIGGSTGVYPPSTPPLH